MLRPERVLVIFCLKAKDSEGFDSNVGQNPLSISRAFELCFLFEGNMDTHRRTIVEDRTAIPTKVIFHVRIETLLY